MARPRTHLWRLLKWGRTLARHGALRGIERDPLTPPPVARLIRIARFGTIQPREPDYAARHWALWQASDWARLDGVDGAVRWNVVYPGP